MLSAHPRAQQKTLFHTFSREIIGKTDNAHRVYYETINVRYTLVQSNLKANGFGNLTRHTRNLQTREKCLRKFENLQNEALKIDYSYIKGSR